MFKLVTSEICSTCGGCGKNYPFVALSPDEIKTIEDYTALKVDSFCNPVDQAKTKHFLKFKDNGDCIFLDKHNGRYSCSVYTARPGVCRKYPSSKIQDTVCKDNWERSQSTNLASNELERTS